MAGDRSGPAMVVRPWGCSIALLDIALIRTPPPVHLARAPHPLTRVPLPTPALMLARLRVLQRAFTISVDAAGTSIQRMGVSSKQSWRWRRAEQASRLGGAAGRGHTGRAPDPTCQHRSKQMHPWFCGRTTERRNHAMLCCPYGLFRGRDAH
jgi:hypothetical protein